MGRSYYKYPRVGVGVLVRKDEKYLLIKRGQEPSRGLWTVPGGMVKLGESLETAALREIREECNIAISNIRYLDIFEFIKNDLRDQIQYHYIVVDYIAEYKEGTLVAGSDVDEAGWFTFDQVLELETTETTINLIRKAKEK